MIAINPVAPSSTLSSSQLFILSLSKGVFHRGTLTPRQAQDEEA